MLADARDALRPAREEARFEDGQLRQAGISRNEPYAPSAEDGQHVKKV
jgi:hypothetical protein